ncbi:hypothetical protein ACGF3J_37005 [Streptomyces sp. NPDC048171]
MKEQLEAHLDRRPLEEPALKTLKKGLGEPALDGQACIAEQARYR